MHRLLLDCNRTGYPGEYLVARIACRKKELWQEQQKEPGGEATPGNNFPARRKNQDERIWLYLQMEGSLRRLLGPLLFFFELDNLVDSLRILESGNSQAELEERLAHSLLGKAVQTVLLTGADTAETVAGLEAFLKDRVFEARGLHRAYQEKGVRGAEEVIRRRVLEEGPDSCGHPEVRRFLRRLIDRQNIMTMAKCLHWQPENCPALIGNGSLRQRKSDRSPGKERLKTLLSRFVGGAASAEDDLHPIGLRRILDDHTTMIATRMMRAADPVRCCTGYLWYCSFIEKTKGREKYAAGFASRFTGEKEREG